jgi:hypothetical protein
LASYSCSSQNFNSSLSPFICYYIVVLIYKLYYFKVVKIFLLNRNQLLSLSFPHIYFFQVILLNYGKLF